MAFHEPTPTLLISPLSECQYCEGEEPPGGDEYDDYSKELNQYRRSKEGRGRGRWAGALAVGQDCSHPSGRQAGALAGLTFPFVCAGTV